jgi:hypothetical protein
MQERINAAKVAPEAYRVMLSTELVSLTMVVVRTNAWNRPAISLRSVPGTYQPATHKQAAAAQSTH